MILFQQSCRETFLGLLGFHVVKRLRIMIEHFFLICTVSWYLPTRWMKEICFHVNSHKLQVDYIFSSIYSPFGPCKSLKYRNRLEIVTFVNWNPSLFFFESLSKIRKCSTIFASVQQICSEVQKWWLIMIYALPCRCLDWCQCLST